VVLEPLSDGDSTTAVIPESFPGEAASWDTGYRRARWDPVGFQKSCMAIEPRVRA
jgi:hypothetical protein